jgi:hypothetical protein
MTDYLNQLEQRMHAETDPVLRSSIETQWKEMTKVTEAVPELRTVLPNFRRQARDSWQCSNS